MESNPAPLPDGQTDGTNPLTRNPCRNSVAGMKSGFKPIGLEEFINQYLADNPSQDRDALRRTFEEVLRAYRRGKRCDCGNPLWVVGSVFGRPGCFSCITGEAAPDGNWEIDEACAEPGGFITPLDDLKFDMVDDVFKKHGENAMEKLQEIGFRYYDDDDSWEEEEERAAFPETEGQEQLVAFFESGGPVTDELMETFRTEKAAEEPNIALFRIYFKHANAHLKRLIDRGLDKAPTDPDLLDDLAYFAVYSSILGELIDRYRTACTLEADPARFEVLVRDFSVNTEEFGFDALHELGMLFENEPEKRRVVQRVIENPGPSWLPSEEDLS